MRLQVEKWEENPGKGYLNRLTNLAALLGVTVEVLRQKLELLDLKVGDALKIDWKTGNVSLDPRIPVGMVQEALRSTYYMVRETYEYSGFGRLSFGGYEYDDLVNLLKIGDIEEP